MYALNHSQLRPVYDWVKTFEKFWEGQLDRIRERAEQRARALSSTTEHATRKKGTK